MPFTNLKQRWGGPIDNAFEISYYYYCDYSFQ